MQTIGNFIAGEIVAPRAGKFLDNVDPATGQVYSRVPASDADDVEAAVAAAAAAFPAWSRTPAATRSKLLLAIADRIERNLEQFAMAECIDTGKPLSRCRDLEIPRAVQNFRFFGTAILHSQSDVHEMDRAALNYTLRRPRGVCGLISPWNLPLYLLTWKVAPCLAAGNTAVAKPSELTPMTAHLLALVCNEVGLPPGVLNIVHGAGAQAGAALVNHAAVTTISFTGGTATGAAIAAAAAPKFKRMSLELGGKNPTLVFADADLEHALDTSVNAAFANQGQVCLCGSRLFIEREIFEDFALAFVDRARRLRIGDPLEPGTEQGALVSRAQLEKSASYVRLAAQEGGTLLAGGKPPAELPPRCRAGYFFQPTVLAGLPNHCRTNQEEIFGPVVSLIPFSSEEEAVRLANDVPYGLSASVFTREIDRAHRVAGALDVGTVWINCWLVRDLRVPFGGFKQSGVGREGGQEAMRFFTEPKNVCLRTPEAFAG